MPADIPTLLRQPTRPVYDPAALRRAQDLLASRRPPRFKRAVIERVSDGLRKPQPPAGRLDATHRLHGYLTVPRRPRRPQSVLAAFTHLLNR